MKKHLQTILGALVGPPEYEWRDTVSSMVRPQLRHLGDFGIDEISRRVSGRIDILREVMDRMGAPRDEVHPCFEPYLGLILISIRYCDREGNSTPVNEFVVVAIGNGIFQLYGHSDAVGKKEVSRHIEFMRDPEAHPDFLGYA
jgi:hypothetical protein